MVSRRVVRQREQAREAEKARVGGVGGGRLVGKSWSEGEGLQIAVHEG